jgi:hypothetical protein
MLVGARTELELLAVAFQKQKSTRNSLTTQALALNLLYRLAQHVSIAVIKESDHKLTEKFHQISRSFRGKTFFPCKSVPLIPDSISLTRTSPRPLTIPMLSS